jgi:hypothetical protein
MKMMTRMGMRKRMRLRMRMNHKGGWVKDEDEDEDEDEDGGVLHTHDVTWPLWSTDELGRRTRDDGPTTDCSECSKGNG